MKQAGLPRHWLAASAAGALLMTFSVTAHAVINVDLFSSPAPPNSQFVQSTENNVPDSDQWFDDDGSILGNYRDLYVKSLSGASPIANTSMGIFNNELAFSTDAGVTGVGEIVWDGSNVYTGGNVDFTGLGGIDLTQGGALSDFVVTTIEADLGWNFAVTAWTDEENWTRVNLVATEVDGDGPPLVSTIPFSAFQNPALCGASATDGPPVGPFLASQGVNQIDCGSAGNVNMANLGALKVTLNVTADGTLGGTTNLDLRLASITVPEPAPIALMGLGLVALGAMVALRRRNGMAA